MIKKFKFSICIFVISLTFFSLIANAACVDTNCDKRCKRCWHVNLIIGKYKDCAVEPNCKMACEAERNLAPAFGKQCISITPDLGTIACETFFNAWTKSVYEWCNTNGGYTISSHQKELLEDAKKALVFMGFFSKADFSNVKIKWCDLKNIAGGMAPDRDRIMIDSSYLNSPVTSLIPLLAHEMKHIQQYRRMGSSRFKCKYTKQALKIGTAKAKKSLIFNIPGLDLGVAILETFRKGTHRGNSLEKEAYDFETRVADKVSKTNFPRNFFNSQNYHNSVVTTLYVGGVF